MTVATTILEAIEQIAKQGFATVTVGGQTVTMKSIDDLIKADIYVRGQTAAAAKQSGLGIRVQRIMPRYP